MLPAHSGYTISAICYNIFFFLHVFVTHTRSMLPARTGYTISAVCYNLFFVCTSFVTHSRSMLRAHTGHTICLSNLLQYFVSVRLCDARQHTFIETNLLMPVVDQSGLQSEPIAVISHACKDIEPGNLSRSVRDASLSLQHQDSKIHAEYNSNRRRFVWNSFICCCRCDISYSPQYGCHCQDTASLA